MPSDRQLLLGGAAVLIAVFVGLTCRTLRHPGNQTPETAPEPTIPQAIMAQRIREALTLDQIKFCIHLAYIAAGHGIGYSKTLRHRVQNELFDNDQAQVFSAEFNRLLQISPNFMLGEYTMDAASPLSTQQMADTDELLTFLVTHFTLLQRLHGRILWETTFGYTAKISWGQVDLTFRLLEQIYAEHTQNA